MTDASLSTKHYRGIKGFLIFSSGARPEILRNCPTDEAAFVGLGGTVVATAVLGMVSMTFALALAFRVSVLWVVPAGLVWGLVVYNLDRWLVSSQRRLATRSGQIVAALPRLALAVLFGVVISEPLILKIFEPEIRREMAQEQAEALEEAQRLAREGPRAQEIQDNLDAITALQASGDEEIPGAAAFVEERDQLDAEIDNAQAEFDRAQKELTIEIEGLSATGRSGCGPACRVKTEARDLARAELDRVKAANEPRIAQLVAQIDALRSEHQADLEANQQSEEQEIAERRSRNDELQRQIDADLRSIRERDEVGLLAQIRALGRLGEENSGIETAHIVLALVFIAIDVLPVLGKLINLLGPKHPYELLQEAVDSRVAEHALQLRLEGEHLTDHHEALLAIDREVRAEAERANLEHFIGRAAAVQREIADHLLEEWKTRETTRRPVSGVGRTERATPSADARLEPSAVATAPPLTREPSGATLAKPRAARPVRPAEPVVVLPDTEPTEPAARDSDEAADGGIATEPRPFDWAVEP